jgi:hypothetical protein
MYYDAIPSTTSVNLSLGLSSSFSGSSEATSFVPTLMGASFAFGVSGSGADEPIAPYARAFGNPEASAYSLSLEQPASDQFFEEPFSLSVDIPPPAELTDFSSLNIPFEVGAFADPQTESLPGELLLDLSGVIDAAQVVDPAMLVGLEALAIPVVADVSDSWLDLGGVEAFASPSYSAQLVDESEGLFGNVDLPTTISSLDPTNFPELGAGGAYRLGQDPFAPGSLGAIDALVPLQFDSIDNIDARGFNPLQVNFGIADVSFAAGGLSPLPGGADTVAYPFSLDQSINSQSNNPSSPA